MGLGDGSSTEGLGYALGCPLLSFSGQIIWACPMVSSHAIKHWSCSGPCEVKTFRFCSFLDWHRVTFFNIVAYFSWGFVSSGVEYWRGGSYLLYFLRHPAETGMVVFCELRIIFICRRSMDVQHRRLMFTDISRADWGILAWRSLVKFNDSDWLLLFCEASVSNLMKTV